MSLTYLDEKKKSANNYVMFYKGFDFTVAEDYEKIEIEGGRVDEPMVDALYELHTIWK